MKLPVNISAIIGAVLLAGSFVFHPVQTYHYTFLPESEVRLKGSSNVNTFTCLNPHIEGSIILKYNHDEKSVAGSTAKLHLRVYGFDCGNRMMEEDMQEALKAEDYPLISFEGRNGSILDTLYSSQVGEYYKVKINGVLEMAGAKKTTSLILTAYKKRGTIHLTGVKTINMTRFGIEPPTAAFGMIQADEIIHLQLDLILKPS